MARDHNPCGGPPSLRGSHVDVLGQHQQVPETLSRALCLDKSPRQGHVDHGAWQEGSNSRAPRFMRPPAHLPRGIQEKFLVLIKGCVPLDHRFPSLVISLPIRKMRVGTTHCPESCLLRQPGAAFHGLALSHLPSGFLASSRPEASICANTAQTAGSKPLHPDSPPPLQQKQDPVCGSSSFDSKGNQTTDRLSDLPGCPANQWWG